MSNNLNREKIKELRRLAHIEKKRMLAKMKNGVVAVYQKNSLQDHYDRYIPASIECKKMKLQKINGCNNVVFAITTYNRINYLKDLLKSFVITRNNSYHWYLIVADDGSTDGTIDYLNRMHIPDTDIFIIKNSRAHISKQTNSIFDVCKKLDYDFGFMVDDDIYFTEMGWDNDYIKAYKNYNLDHLVYWNSEHRPPFKKVNKDDRLLAEVDAENCMGCLWTFTPKLFERVGHFDENSFKGANHAHQEYTIRCCRAGFNQMRTLFDVINSEKKIKLYAPNTHPHYISFKDNDHITNNRKSLDKTISGKTIKINIKESQKIIQVNSNKMFNLGGINRVSHTKNSIYTIIPVHGRHGILRCCINAIKNQSVKSEILLVVSNKADEQFAQKMGVAWINFPNKPLSRKFQAGFNHVRRFKPTFVMLVGSDDLLTPDWLKEGVETLVTNNYDVVGKDYHFIFDNSCATRYVRGYIKTRLSYLPPELKNSWSLGSGRIYSGRILDKTDWKIFESDANSSLDRYSGLNLHKKDAVFGLIKESNFLSVRDEWECITKLDTIMTNSANFIKAIDIYNRELMTLEKNYLLSKQIDPFFNEQGVKQLHVCKNLQKYADKIKKLYNLTDVTDKNNPTLFFGIDFDVIKTFSKLSLIWPIDFFDSAYDRGAIDELKKNDGKITHYVLSDDTKTNLDRLGIKSSRIDMLNIYPEVANAAAKMGNMIYVYNDTKTVSNELLSLIGKFSKCECLISNKMSSKRKPYEECYVAIILNHNKENDEQFKKFGAAGIPVVTQSKTAYPGAIYSPYHDIAGYVNFIKQNYYRFKQQIIDSTNRYLSKQKKEQLICYIPIFYRHNILQKVVRSLRNQTKKVVLIGVVSNREDEIFCRKINLEYVYTENRPLGKKFQMGMEFCKIFYPKGIYIQGSDDLMVKDYVEKTFKYLDSFDLIGNNVWNIYDQDSNTLYKCRYIHKIIKNYWGENCQLLDVYNFGVPGIPAKVAKTNPYVIGAGRLLNGDFLDKIGWKVYPMTRDRSLDSFSTYFLIMSGATYHVLKDDYPHIISYKGDNDMLNTIDKIKKSSTCHIETIDDPQLKAYIASL